MPGWSPDALLLARLRGSALAVAKEELAQAAWISEAEVADRVAGLRAAGFDVEQHPQLGYRLCASPDRLVADDLWSRLNLKNPPVREIIVLAETGSTNDVAAHLGRQGAEGGLLVLAESQTAGRGRFGRQWASAAHRGLWMSLLVRPELPLADWPRLTTWAAVAIARAVETETSARVEIKWPNDLQVGGRKIAGILTEMGTDERQRPFAVLGIGVNANQSAGDFPPELAETAQSLRLATGHPVDRAALVVAILQEFQRQEHALRVEFPAIVQQAARRSSLLGQWVTVKTGAQRIEGCAEALDESGHLLLRRADGGVMALTAGEVTLHLS